MENSFLPGSAWAGVPGLVAGDVRGLVADGLPVLGVAVAAADAVMTGRAAALARVLGGDRAVTRQPADRDVPGQRLVATRAGSETVFQDGDRGRHHARQDAQFTDQLATRRPGYPLVTSGLRLDGWSVSPAGASAGAPTQPARNT